MCFSVEPALRVNKELFEVFYGAKVEISKRAFDGQIVAEETDYIN
jgi:hypothetical protein